MQLKVGISELFRKEPCVTRNLSVLVSISRKTLCVPDVIRMDIFRTVALIVLVSTPDLTMVKIDQSELARDMHKEALEAFWHRLLVEMVEYMGNITDRANYYLTLRL